MDCNFRNTGAKIEFDENKFLRESKIDGIGLEKHKLDMISALKDCMGEYWVGCYLNGKKILSKEEKIESSKKIKDEYLKFKDEEISNILDYIGEQVNSSGHKR